MLESLASCPQYRMFCFCHQPTRYTQTQYMIATERNQSVGVEIFTESKWETWRVCTRLLFLVRKKRRNVRLFLCICTELMLTNREKYTRDGWKPICELMVNHQHYIWPKNICKNRSLSPFILSRTGKQEWSNEWTGGSERYGTESE